MAVVAVAIVALVWALRAGDAPLDELGRDGEDAPFDIRPGGELFRDRIVVDEEGAPDAGYVFHDLPLTIGVAGRKRGTVAAIEVKVDGRTQRRRRIRCIAGRCPRRAQWTVTPSLAALAAGEHEVTIAVTGPAAPNTRAARAVKTFRVRTGNEPPPRAEAATPSSTSGSDPAALPPSARRRALRIVRLASRRGPLASVVGTQKPLVLALGSLDVAGRRRGATALLQLKAPRRDVVARVPAYTARRPDRIVATSVNLRVRELRDLLIDIDLTTGRVIAIEPGPLSRTERWQPSGPLPQPGVEDED